MRHAAAFLLLVGLVAVTSGEEPQPAAGPLLRFSLLGGGQVTGTPQIAAVAVQTGYGRLEIPVGELLSVTPGLDSHPDLAEEFAKWVRDLCAPQPEKQQTALEALTRHGPMLRKLLADAVGDGEARTRAAPLLSKWEEEAKTGPEARLLPLLRQDQVRTRLFTVVGKAQVKQFPVKTEYGEVQLDLALVREFQGLPPAFPVVAPQPGKASVLSLQLRDGSLVKGASELKTLRLTVPFAKLEFPLILAGSVDLAAGLKTARVGFRNGDELRGVLEVEGRIVLKTAYGVLDVPVEQVTRLEVLASELEDGLVLSWSFDDQTAADAQGRVVGQVRGDVTWEDGITGKAPCFSSRDTRIVWNTPRLSFNGWPQITFSVWVKMKSYSTYGTVFSRAAGARGCGVGLNLGGAYGARWTGGGFYFAVDEKTAETVFLAPFRPNVQPHPPQQKWYHLVGTYDGRFVRCYVDGQPAGEKEVGTPGLPIWDLPEAETVLGNHAADAFKGWTDQYFPGLVDDLRIWRRALTPAEVRRLFDETLRKSKAAGKPQPPIEF